MERFFAKRVQARLEQNAAKEKEDMLAFDALDEKNIVESVGFEASESDTIRAIPKQRKVTETRELTTTITPAVESDDDEEIESDVEEAVAKSAVNLNLEDVLSTKKARKRTLNSSGEDTMDSDDDDEGEGEDGDGLGEFDFHGTEMQKYLREAFIDDDVVEDFLKEKRAKQKEEREAQGVTAKLYLPGWGNWAGSGIKETRKKKARVVKRVVKAEKRLDQKISNAIILNDADKLGSKFTVSVLSLAVFLFTDSRSVYLSICIFFKILFVYLFF